MRRLALTVALFAAGVVALAGQKPSPGAETARWVAEQLEQRDTGRDSRLDITMRLYDRHDRARVRSLVLTSLRGNASRGDRILLRFVAPNEIKGTGFLVWEHPKADDERFLYLPALGRVRRIAGSEKQESFAGSDLSYEDIGGREIDDYTYTFVQRDGAWTDSDGRNHPAWQLESRTVDAAASYPRTQSLVRKDNFMLVSADIYNRRNELEKQYRVRGLKNVDGVWTATDVLMRNELQHTRTEMVVNEARYNIGLSENDFSRRLLEQGVR